MRRSIFLVLFLFGFLGSQCGQVRGGSDSPPSDTEETLWEQQAKIIEAIEAAVEEDQKKMEDSTTELIPVKAGDIVQYPLNAEPIEIEAEINSLSYACTLMPGDSFEVIDTTNYDHYVDRRSKIQLQKKEGITGNHQICHGNSFIAVRGTHEVEKSKDGTPQIVNKVYSPFVPYRTYLYNIHERKKLPTTLSATIETETILFKVGDIIQYPQDANFIEVESDINQLIFRCKEAPGDSFEVSWINNYSNGENSIGFQKTEGTAGNQNICHKESRTTIDITNCVLKRTEGGMPEGLLCNHSLKTLFNPPEENTTNE